MKIAFYQRTFKFTLFTLMLLVGVLFSTATAMAARRDIGTTLFTYTGQPDGVNSLDWSQDSSRVLSTSFDAHIWDAFDGENVRVYPKFSDYSGIILDSQWSPDGSRIAYTGDEVWIVDVATGKLLQTLRYPFSEGGPTAIRTARWSPDGRYIASVPNPNTFDERLLIWDVATGKLVAELEGHVWTIMSLSWSPDGKYIATGGLDNTVRIWDVARQETVKVYEGHQIGIMSLSWSPDGKSLATGDAHGNVHVWKPSTGNIKPVVYQTQSGQLSELDWSPDGKRIAVAGENTVELFNACNGKYLYTYKHQSRVISVSWSPNGKYIASGDAGAPWDEIPATAQIWTAK